MYTYKLKKIKLGCYLTLIFIAISCLETEAASLKPPGAAIASAQQAATEAGMEILNAGGNAFDAAVTVATMLNVLEPMNSGLGGSGFFLMYDAKKQRYLLIDARGTAPQSVKAGMFLDKKGDVMPEASLNGSLSATIPGEVAGIVYLAKHYGRLPLKQTLAPAIRAAKEGFLVNHFFLDMLRKRLDAIRASPAAAAIFLENNQLPSMGYRVVQADLAKTLAVIAHQGEKGFYQGIIAKKLVDGVRKAGGIWSLNDLANYRVVIRKPLIAQHDELTVITAPLPSAGGIALVTMLNVLKGIELQHLLPMTRMQVIIEAMRRAFWDRADFLGDPAFVNVPVKQLVSSEHAKNLAETIQLNKPTPSSLLEKRNTADHLKHNTTHFSVIDSAGNIVSATLSLNFMFGSGFIPPGTGVLLNDEMDDFSLKSDAQNVYGIIGSHANGIQPRKRPLSSMTPTILVTPERVAILGTPGGSRISTMVLLAVLDFLEERLPISWVSLRRFHHQYLPDEVQFEQHSLSANEQNQLKAMGYILRELDQQYGDMQAILWDKKHQRLYASSDPRRFGKAMVATLDTQYEQQSKHHHFFNFLLR